MRARASCGDDAPRRDREVSGSSVSSTPSGRSASLTALTIAAGGPMAPPSPMPLAPNAYRATASPCARCGSPAPRWRRAADSRPGSTPAAGPRVERHLLVQRGADALRGAAVDLTVDDHRIDQHAAVLDDDVVEDFDGARVRVDGNHHGMRGVAEGAAVAHRLVAGRDLESAGIDVGRQILRPQIPGPRDLA